MPLFIDFKTLERLYMQMILSMYENMNYSNHIYYLNECLFFLFYLLELEMEKKLFSTRLAPYKKFSYIGIADGHKNLLEKMEKNVEKDFKISRGIRREADKALAPIYKEFNDLVESTMSKHIYLFPILMYKDLFFLCIIIIFFFFCSKQHPGLMTGF